jgi:hypothetical protein
VARGIHETRLSFEKLARLTDQRIGRSAVGVFKNSPLWRYVLWGAKDPPDGVNGNPGGAAPPGGVDADAHGADHHQVAFAVVPAQAVTVEAAAAAAAAGLLLPSAPEDDRRRVLHPHPSK